MKEDNDKKEKEAKAIRHEKQAEWN